MYGCWLTRVGRMDGRVGMVALAAWRMALDGIVAVDRLVAVGRLLLDVHALRAKLIHH